MYISLYSECWTLSFLMGLDHFASGTMGDTAQSRSRRSFSSGPFQQSAPEIQPDLKIGFLSVV